jgi:hypothetical protein
MGVTWETIARRSIALLAIGLLLLGGCRPLYLPPVPEPLAAPRHFELTGEATAVNGRPALRLTLRTVPAESWLAVQWFAPDNREAASESVRVGPDDAGRTMRLSLPNDVAARPGRWRAVLSFGEAVVRQFSVEVRAETERAAGD